MADVKACLYAALGKRHLGVPEYDYEPIMSGNTQLFKCRLRLEGHRYTAESTATSKRDAQTHCARDFAQYLVRRGMIPASELPPFGSRGYGQRAQFDSGGPSSSRLGRYQPYNRPPSTVNRDAASPAPHNGRSTTMAQERENECRELRNILATYKLNEAKWATERVALEKELAEANSKLATSVDNEKRLNEELGRLQSAASASMADSGGANQSSADISSLRAELKRKSDEWSLAISLAESLRIQLDEANANLAKGQSEPSDLLEWKKLVTEKAERVSELRYRGEIAHLKTRLNAATKELGELKTGTLLHFNGLNDEKKKLVALDYFEALVSGREKKARKEFDEAIAAVKEEFNARKKLHSPREMAAPCSTKSIRCLGTTTRHRDAQKSGTATPSGLRQQATSFFELHAMKPLEQMSSEFDSAFSELMKSAEGGKRSKK